MADPYNQIFEQNMDPALFDDYLTGDELPQFNLQLYHSPPSLNYYAFKSSKTENEPANVQKENTENPESSGLDFLDDDFELQAASQDSEISRLLNDISEQSENVSYNVDRQNDNLGSNFQNRFVVNTENERNTFLEERENKNTKRKMLSSVNTFKQFLENIKNDQRDMFTIPAAELNIYLQEFFIGIRKESKDKTKPNEYQPGTLDGFHGMINRYLRINNYPYDIMKDPLFKESRDCLKAKKKHLKELGLGNRPNASEAIDSDEEQELFASGAFGPDSPDSLLAAIWYLNTIHFGLRGSHEHRQLKWGDINLEKDRDGQQRLVYNERLTKTRDGTDTKNTRAYSPKSWDDRHISIYLQYKSQRPVEMMEKDSPFYLGVNRALNSKIWFKCQPLGEKKLQTIMKSAVKKTNVDQHKKLTNHSGRKTAITRLIDQGIPITSVQQHSGHKSLSSLNNYAKNSIKTQKRMCDILNGNKSETFPNPDTKKVEKYLEKPDVPDVGTEKTGSNENRNTASENHDKSSSMTSSNIIPNSNQAGTLGNMPFDVFPRGTIIQGGTFNFVFGSNYDHNQLKSNKENSPPKMQNKKRKKFVIESDSE